MQISTSHSRLHSKTLTSFHIRKKMSLHIGDRKRTQNIESSEDRAICAKLERDLQGDYKRSSQLIAEPEDSISDYDELSVENKLWRYFEGRMSQVRYKLQREQVNFCQREFHQIKGLINKRIDNHSSNILKLKVVIKGKYEQTNNLFEEHKQINMTKLLQSMKNKKNKKWVPADYSEKLKLLKDHIESISDEISTLQVQSQTEVRQKEKLIKEWTAFLKNILRQGYFMNNGVRDIFSEMAREKYVLVKEDFPDFMDHVTISCMLKVYAEVKQQVNKKITQRQPSLTLNKNASGSINLMREIAKEPHLKHVYQGTKQYMQNWVRNASWKEQRAFPKIKRKRVVQPEQDWRTEEKRRMNVVYTDRQTLLKVKHMMFGPKVEPLFY